MILPIPEKLKVLRAKTSMTQTELARKLGVTRSSVNAWEMGISVPTPDKIVEMALLFGTSTDFIFGLEERDMCDSSKIDPKIRSSLEDLIRYLNNLK
jgi:transcriptional regulator with XRE-family HTH domain